MRNLIRKAKEKLFFILIEKDQDMLREYQKYKWSHVDRKENKLRSWSYMILLNIKYRILNIRNSDTAIIKTNSSEIKLPYLEGSESAILSRPSPVHFAQSLMNYDIISFDIFDTLVLRPFAKPQDLFMIVGHKLKKMNFMSIRMEAEKEAREKAYEKKGNREVTIYDIYEIIEWRTGINKNYGVQIEFETELEFCFANPYMKEVFEILKSQNKKLIAISDMYLPKEMIIKLLEKMGYTGFLDVFVSCEYNCSKSERQLFKIAINKYGKNQSFVHIGDNYNSDIIAAQELGIDTKYYKNVHEVGEKYRADGMSELIGSFYSGIVNTHLHNGLNQYTPYYEYGFIYGGLYIVGFCNWIREYAKTHQIDKVLFLSRDGDIYHKVFNVLFQDVDNEYVYWSRIANTKYTAEKNREDFLTRMVTHKAYEVNDITVSGLLKSLDLVPLINVLDQYELKPEEIIHKGNIKLLEKLFVSNWDFVVQEFSKNIGIIKDYFLSIIGNSKKVAVVDVGWIGSGGAGIKYLIEEKFQLPCEVHSLVAASRSWNHNANINELMKKETVPYIFSRMHNRLLYDVHSSNNGVNNIFFELLTQACYPSFSWFEKVGDKVTMAFDIPEVENYGKIKEVQKGIMDFAKLYKHFSANNKYLLNISGYDAYLPFRMIIRDLTFIKKYFGDFLFSRGVIGDTEKQSIEKLKDILHQARI